LKYILFETFLSQDSIPYDINTEIEGDSSMLYMFIYGKISPVGSYK